MSIQGEDHIALRSVEPEEPSTIRSGDELLYRADEIPPWYSSFALAIQQMLFCVGSLVAIPLITMPVLCADDSPSTVDYRTALIGTGLFSTGLSTFIQTTYGVRLPVFQGPAAAYLVAVIAVMGTEDLKCLPELDVGMNTTDENLLVTPGRNDSKNVLFDRATNTTIHIDPRSNYYRDHDGFITNSNDVWMNRLRVIQGGVILGSVVQMLLGLTGSIGFLMRFVGPLTIGPILTMVTYGMVDLICSLTKQNWIVSLITMLAFYINSICMDRVLVPIPSFYFKKKGIGVRLSRLPIFSMFSVVFSIAIGWVTSYIMTSVKGTEENSSSEMDDVIASSPWFRLPYPFQFGWPIFTAGATFGILSAVIAGILESIGDYNATASVCMEQPPPKHAVNRGILMEGVGVLINGVLGTGSATTSWSTNIVVIGTSKVASRRVFQYTGVLLMLFGIFTKTLSIFVFLPKAVAGGILCAAGGVIISVGVETLSRVDMKTNRNLFVFGFSVLFGMVISNFANKNPSSIDVGVAELNSIISVMLRNPMWVSGVIGFVLDNISPGSRKSRGLEESETIFPGTRTRNLDVYKPPFWADTKWNKWIPICSGFQETQKQRDV